MTDSPTPESPQTFAGVCVGGPFDKKSFAHTSSIKKLYRPMVASLSFNENTPVKAVEIGEYRLNDFGQWCWWETKAGRAMNELFGEAEESK